MWPERGEALSRTIEAERAIEDLYAEALRRWSPELSAAVLPTLAAQLTAAGASYNGDPNATTLPPDAGAVAQTADGWSTTTEAVIIAGIALLWAATVIEAMEGLGIPLPELPDGDVPNVSTSGVDSAVLHIVDYAVGDMNATDVVTAAARVDASPALSATRDELLATQRQRAAETPAIVQKHVEAAVQKVTAAPEPESRTAVLPRQRTAVAATIDPAGSDMRGVARTGGMQAAAVQNHAVVTAAAQQNAGLPVDEREELDKVWIATLDGKTRPTHWAADGQRAPLAGTFTVGGEAMQFPGDPTASAAETINCRCRVGVLAVDEKLPDEVDRHTERLNGRDSVAINRDGRTQAEEIERRKDAGNVRARDDPDGIGRVASAAPSEQEHHMKPSDLAGTKTVRVAESDLSQVGHATLAADDTSTDGETYLTFTDALFAVTGTPTSDGRMLASDINLIFRDTPLPLQWCEEMEGGHYGSVTVGVIEKISLAKGKVLGSGYMLNNEDALKAIDLASHGVTNPSVDLGNVDWVATDEKGNVVTEENYVDDMDVYMTVTEAEVIATTLVATPAFGETRFRLNETRESRAPMLVASAAEKFQPRVYDPALFADPKLSGPTLLTITEDGHVFGHIACFGECHRSIQAECIMAPRSQTGYRHFHSSPGVHLSDGNTLPVGRLTVGTGHASESLAAGPAIEHYDNTGTCFALVRAGEDRHGIWVSGVAAPWATAEQIEMGLSSPLSGDWRRLDGNLELVAALSVNTPGFLARGVTDANGAATALVASLAPSPQIESGGIAHLTIADIKAAVAEALAESGRAAELAQRRETALALARETVGDPPPELTPTERVEQLLAEANI